MQRSTMPPAGVSALTFLTDWLIRMCKASTTPTHTPVTFDGSVYHSVRKPASAQHKATSAHNLQFGKIVDILFPSILSTTPALLCKQLWL